jgi:hypothetical protein
VVVVAPFKRWSPHSQVQNRGTGLEQTYEFLNSPAEYALRQIQVRRIPRLLCFSFSFSFSFSSSFFFFFFFNCHDRLGTGVNGKSQTKRAFSFPIQTYDFEADHPVSKAAYDLLGFLPVLPGELNRSF